MKRWHHLLAAVAAAVPLAASFPAESAHADQPAWASQVDQRLAQELTGTSTLGTLSWRQKTQAEAGWVMAAQTPDGAISQYVNRGEIAGYEGNYAAMGLATAAKATGNRDDLQAAWNWLHWYAAHEDSNGFVTNYNVATDGTETSTGSMDSTDAYAGTFLMATDMAYEVAPDRSQLKNLRSGIDGAVRAIRATTDSDGMTWAQPSWHVKYLMDEAETYAGLRAATRLYSVLGRNGAAEATAAQADHLYQGVQTLWNPSVGAFDWAEGEGYTQPTDWRLFYPDEMEQAWAVSFGLANKNETAIIHQHLSSLPAWKHPDAPVTYESDGQIQSGTAGYWPMAGLADSARINRVRSTRKSITASAVDRQFGWPFTTGTMGQLLMLRQAGIDLKRPSTTSASVG